MNSNDHVDNNKLIQELLDEENDKIATGNPAFAKRREAIREALDILTKAGVYSVIISEMDYGDDTPGMIQYNNAKELDSDPYSIESKLRSNSRIWKLAYSFANIFGAFYVNKDQPRWKNGLNMMYSMLNVSYWDWMHLKKEILENEEL